MNLNQVTVPTLDVAKAIAFYKTLGLKLIVEALPHYARFECPNGEATFSLSQVDSLPTGGGVSVYFECENLDEIVQDLIEKGIKFDSLPKDERWLWREARLKDLDQNKLILFFGGDNRKNPPWRINE